MNQKRIKWALNRKRIKYLTSFGSKLTIYCSKRTESSQIFDPFRLSAHLIRFRFISEPDVFRVYVDAISKCDDVSPRAVSKVIICK